MQERREDARGRTRLRGIINFNNRSITCECVVRNLSRLGARLEFAGPTLVPSEFEITVRPGDHRRARLVWGDSTQAGVMFTA